MTDDKWQALLIPVGNYISGTALTYTNYKANPTKIRQNKCSIQDKETGHPRQHTNIEIILWHTCNITHTTDKSSVFISHLDCGLTDDFKRLLLLQTGIASRFTRCFISTTFPKCQRVSCRVLQHWKIFFFIMCFILCFSILSVKL